MQLLFFCFKYSANSANYMTSWFQGTHGPFLSITTKRRHFLWDSHRKVAVTVTWSPAERWKSIKFPLEHRQRNRVPAGEEEREFSIILIFSSESTAICVKGNLTAWQRELCVSPDTNNTEHNDISTCWKPTFFPSLEQMETLIHRCMTQKSQSNATSKTFQLHRT